MGEWSFDYVVVGGGVAACFVAPQLARDGASVAILEAGPAAAPQTGTIIDDVTARLRNPLFDYAHTHTIAGLDRGHFSQGKGLGGGANINGGLWIPPTPAERCAAGLPLQPPPPPPLERPRWLDPVSREIAAQLTTHGVLATHGADEPPYTLPATHVAGRRRSLAQTLATSHPDLAVLQNQRVHHVARAHRGTDIVLEDGATVHAHKAVLIAAGVLGSLGVLERSRAAAGLPDVAATLTDHLAVRIPLRFDAAALFDNAPSDLSGAGGALARVCAKIDLGDPSHPMLLFGSPIAVRWPKRGVGQLLRRGMYTLTVMLCYPRSRGYIRRADGHDLRAIAFEVVESDITKLLSGVRYLQELLGHTSLASMGGDDPLSLQAFITRRIDRAYVLRHLGTMHHPVGAVSSTGCIDERTFAADYFPNTWFVDSSSIATMPHGTIMPYLHERAPVIADIIRSAS